MSERHSQFARDALDFYREPVWCVELLAEAEPFAGTVWDPACGAGTIPNVFLKRGHIVRGSDIAERGQHNRWDFLGPPGWNEWDVDNIVCNPPFRLTKAFAERALEVARRKVALLVQLKFLASHARYPLFTETPLKRVLILSSRPSMPPGALVDGDGLMDGKAPSGGSIDFCWLVWEHAYFEAPTISWLKREKRP